MDIVFPLGDRALGFDLEEERVAGVYKVRLAIDGGAGHAGFFDSGVVGIVAQGHPVEEIDGGTAFGNAAGHVKAIPGDRTLDGGAGFFGD